MDTHSNTKQNITLLFAGLLCVLFIAINFTITIGYYEFTFPIGTIVGYILLIIGAQKMNYLNNSRLVVIAGVVGILAIFASYLTIFVPVDLSLLEEYLLAIEQGEEITQQDLALFFEAFGSLKGFTLTISAISVVLETAPSVFLFYSLGKMLSEVSSTYSVYSDNHFVKNAKIINITSVILMAVSFVITFLSFEILSTAAEILSSGAEEVVLQNFSGVVVVISILGIAALVGGIINLVYSIKYLVEIWRLRKLFN